MTDLTALEANVERAKRRLEAARRQEMIVLSTQPHPRLAEKLHKAFCNQPHEDRCGWYFGADWTRGERRRWLDKAEAMTGGDEKLAEQITQTWQ